MVKHQDKKRSQALGIFYTPQEVVNFILDILNTWKEKEESESGRWQSRKHYPSIIDPAVGEGVFLKTAIDKGLTKPDWVFGLDIDENAVKRWKEINLLKEFGGNEKDLEAHFFHQNGLDRIHWEQHTKKYRYKLKQEDIANQQFNAVVGNPPYGGLGIYDEMILLSQAITGSEKTQKINIQVLDDLFGGQEVKQFKRIVTLHKKISLSEQRILELKSLSKALLGFEVWKDDKLRINRLNHTVSIGGIPFNLKDVLDVKEIEKLKSFPIEILFLERFIQLAKPGGWIAIIIPDGILTNSNSDYVREFISRKAKIEAVISLPRNTFKNAGTSAKTSILFLRKHKDSEKPEKDYPVFLASIENINSYNFQKIIDTYKKFYNKKEKNMDKSQLVQITKDQNGTEVVMVRADKTLKELMSEKPSSRWDPDYWRPVYDEMFARIDKKHQLIPLKELLTESIIAPDHVRASKGEKIGNENDCEYRTLKDLMFSGLNYSEINYCSDNAFKRLKRSQLKVNDILFAGSGVGAIGRVGLVMKVSKKSCVGDLFIIRNLRISPFYILVFFLTEFGQLQIERIFHGIQSAKISTDEIGAIKIALSPQKIQENIESKYKIMSSYHDKAMQAKKKIDINGYKTNLEIAEKMLKDLIARTEAVIRGEREDID